MLIAYFLACHLKPGSLIMYRNHIYQVADVYTYTNLALTSLELVPTQGANPVISGAHFQDTALMEVHIPLM